jgi:hypothetical protein
MALQHHFVVVVEDGKLWIDHDTTDHKFFLGSVWDTEIEDWKTNYEESVENEEAMKLLSARLKSNTLPCQTCGKPVDEDTYEEELGFCVPCQHDYFDQKENA